MKKTFLIIVHYGDPVLTIDCLESVFKNKTDISTVVINNTSLGLPQKINSFPNLIVFNSPRNLGFGAANNLGIRTALDKGAGQVILLNNDTLIGDKLFPELISFAAATDKIGLVSPKIYFAPGFEFHKKRYRTRDLGKVIWYAGGVIDWKNVIVSHRGLNLVDKGSFDQAEETEFATGCCLLIKKELIARIGLFDEKYFLYYEDVDYSLRARLSGFKIFYYPKVYLYHKNAASSRGPGSSLHQYYQTRNRLYFGFKYASLRTKFALLRQSISDLFIRGIKRNSVLDYYFCRMGQGDIT